MTGWCPSRKRAYRRRRDARRALRQIQTLGYPIKSTYRCSICGQHHLTSKLRKDQY